MNPRQAFEEAIRFELRKLREDGEVQKTDNEIEVIVNKLTNDPDFFEAIDNILLEYIEDNH